MQTLPTIIFQIVSTLSRWQKQFLCAIFRPTGKPIDQVLQTFKDPTENRKHPWFISHMRSHTELRGFIATGNSQVDKLISNGSKDAVLQEMDTFISCSPVSLHLLEQTHILHNKFHMSANNLKALFSDITMTQWKHLVQACKNCAPLAPLGPLQTQGVKLRGLSPNKLWQMDVTHIPSSGKLKYVHVIVDTYSKCMQLQMS